MFLGFPRKRGSKGRPAPLGGVGSPHFSLFFLPPEAARKEKKGFSGTPRNPVRGNTAQIRRQRSLKSDILKKNRSKSVRKRRLMPFKIMQLPNQDKLCQTFSLPVLERLYDRQTIEELISAFHHKPTRARKLTMTIVIYVLICWSLLLGSTLGAVYAELCSAERYLAEQDPEELPGRGAWVYRRKQVGVQILRRLFRLKCKPLALPQTPGAFAFGLRLMAL